MTLTNYTSEFLDGSTTSTGCISTGETTLTTLTLPAGQATGKFPLKVVRAWGTVANNANAKTLKFYWGSTSQAFVLPASAATTWQLEVWVADITANSQTVTMRCTTGVIATVTTDTFNASPAEIENNAIIVKTTGTGGATNDIVQAAMLITNL